MGIIRQIEDDIFTSLEEINGFHCFFRGEGIDVPSYLERASTCSMDMAR